MKVLSGSSNRPLAEKIARYIGKEIHDTTVSSFPDGETFVKINENVRGADVFIVQSTCPPTNHHLMELLIMIDAAKRASAGRITAVIPFYGYARQDRKDQPRVPITAKLVANIVTVAGANRILTMDLHAQQIQGFFDIPVDHLYSAPVFYRFLRDRKLNDVVVVSPDIGGLKMANAYANMLGTGLAIVGKRRISGSEVEAINVVGEVEGKNVIMVDDLTETAGTLTAAAKRLKECGAKKIIACVAHAVLGDMALDRLKKSSLTELVTTDSVPQRTVAGFKCTVLSIAELLGEAMKRAHKNESVTSLFELNGGSKKS
ncbi:MAG: ribose-phosphate pyrophosphokinase [Verrucomicrobiae bacterium]|nr:ribose-phosphate pyrophosphokinase [Verrucomicrobiae bacterium]